MDNDTDMAEFLKLGPDVLNFAYAGRVSFYHPLRDNLAKLDRRNIGHIGSSALRTVEGLLESGRGEAGLDLAFVDTLSRKMIIPPCAICIALMVAGLAVSLVLHVRAGAAGFHAPPSSRNACSLGRRRVGLKIESETADAVLVVIPEPAALAALDVGGETPKPEGDWVYC